MKPAPAPSRMRWMSYSAALIAATGLIVLLLMVQASSQPTFCGTCHIMAPYYESWKHSSHQDVDCVDCHIPPGVSHELRKKWEALSMVASYFTGTYGTNPWTEIDDSACLQCHERRLLSSQELFGDVLFDHSPHLSELRKGKKLRCTSCHSQIVQGQHIAVTASTCILCHFKGEQFGQDTRQCTLCHTVPDNVITKGLLTFDHGDVERFDMNCESCHAGSSSPTDGRVPRERCFTCHNEDTRLAEYGDTDLMHRMHVTDHKVDCLNCHLEIQHGASRHLGNELAETQCASCHDLGHSRQHSLYAGIGGRGVPPMPAPMFLAGVSCESCHQQWAGHDSQSALGTEISCMSCHGPRYRPVYFRWKETMASRTRALRSQFDRTAALFAGTEPEPLQNARHNLELVENGRGVHNVRFSYALLARSHDQLNEARAGLDRSGLKRPWPEVPYESPCMPCHQGIEDQTGSSFGREFRHSRHVVDQKIPCETCHRSHEEKEVGEVLRFGSEGCASCHHSQPDVDCLSCHSSIMEKSVVSFRGEFGHELHYALLETCDACHTAQPAKSFLLERDSCSACHDSE